MDGADRILGLAPGRDMGLAQAAHQVAELGQARAARGRQIGHRGAGRALGRCRGVLAHALEVDDQVLQRPLNAVFSRARRGLLVEPLGQTGDLAFERVEGIGAGAGPAGLVDLGGEAAQHVLDRAHVDPGEGGAAFVRHLGEPAGGGQLLDAVGQRLDPVLEPARRPVGQVFELDHQRFDAPGEFVGGRAADGVEFAEASDQLVDLPVDHRGLHRRQRVDLLGERFDLARQGEQRRALAGALAQAVAVQALAHVLDRQRQAAQVAGVVAQAPDIRGQSVELQRQIVEAAAVRGRDELAQFGQFVQDRCDRLAVAAARGERVDLCGKMGDLELEAAVALLRASFGEPADLGLDPCQRFQDGIEPVAPVEAVEPGSELADRPFERLEGGALLLGPHRRLGRGNAIAELAQILAQARERRRGGRRALEGRGVCIAVEGALARADIGYGGGEAVAAEHDRARHLRRRRCGRPAAGVLGPALDVAKPAAHRLDRVGDHGGGALLALDGGALALRQAALGALHPLRDRIERACGARIAVARQALGHGRLCDERVHALAREIGPGGGGLRGRGRLHAALGEAGKALRESGDVLLLDVLDDDVRLPGLFADLAVEPLAERHPGAARGGFRRVTRARIDALDAPGQAGRHVTLASRGNLDQRALAAPLRGGALAIPAIMNIGLMRLTLERGTDFSPSR